MSDLAEICEKCFPLSQDPRSIEAMHEWLIKDNFVDLHKLCRLMEYYVVDAYTADKLYWILIDTGTIMHGDSMTLRSSSYMFHDNDLREFYCGKSRIQKFKLSDIVNEYSIHLGYKNIIYGTINDIYDTVDKIEMNNEKINIKRLNFMINLVTSNRIYFNSENYPNKSGFIKLLLTAKKMGYNKEQILKRFNITEALYDVIATQDYYEYSLKLKMNDYDRYLLEKSEKDFTVACISLIDALLNSLECLGTKNAVVSDDLIYALANMPGYTRYAHSP